MDVGGLRKMLEGLPDDMKVIGEWKDGGQDSVLSAEVCTYENGGLHYSEETMKVSLRDGDGLDRDCWEKLKKPTFKISV
jgi:hypothetical protein